MLKRLLAGLLALALPTLPLPAQASSFGDAERAALDLKADARYAEAADAFLALIDGAASDSDAIAAARHEYHAVMAHVCATRAARFAVHERFERIARSELGRRHPGLRDRCLHLALDLARSAGELPHALELTRELGYLRGWTIIGPFDNERGSGFSRPFPPEQEIDLDAAYDGKKREVRWRACPVGNPVGGVVDLDAMLRPNDQVLAYAAIALEVDQATDAMLLLGCDEAFKVYLNGEELLARDLRRRFRPDQDIVGLRLRAGANLLLLKVCDQEGPFEFAARLRAIDGTPLTGVTVSGEPDALAQAALAEPAPEPTTAPPFGARDVLAALDPIEPADATRLAMLFALDEPDDPTERRDHELARDAVAALPDDATARYLLAFTRVRSGRSEERDENARRNDYHTLLQSHPNHAEALRSLADLELIDVETPNIAIALLRRALAHNPDFGAARENLARALRMNDLDAIADVELARAAATGSPIAVREWFQRRGTLGDHHGAVAAIDELFAAGFDVRAAVLAADALSRTGDRAAAAEVLTRATTMFPFDREPWQELAILYEAGEEDARALEAWSAWLRICPEDDGALAAVAALHAKRGDVDQQREVLRTVVELNPNRKSEQRQLEFLMADAIAFYEPYEIDADELVKDASIVPDDAEAANDPVHYALIHDVVHAYRNGTTSTYHHEVVRILNEDGARSLTSYYVPYYWGEQRARMLSARVVKADGTELRPRLSTSYVRLPPLAVGDVCEFRYRVDDTAPTFFGDYFGLEHLLTADDGAPVHRAVLDVVLDAGRDYRVQTRNGAPEPVTRTLEDGATAHRFELARLPRRPVEERRPSLVEAEPLVRITTYRDWDHFASWWWNLIRKQSEMTPEMAAKVRELTDGLDSEIAKIDALYRFVTTEIQYQAWEFGVHGYKPYSTPVIFERRHGDCKDKSLLLNVLLAEIGVEAYPVLIEADPVRSADDLTLPMVQHFNHCISYLPATPGRDAMFLDGTAVYHPLDTLPEMDCGADVLVVRAGAGEIESIDWTKADENTDVRHFDVQLEPDGSAVVTMTHTPKRQQAVDVRDMLGNEPAKRKEILEQRLSDTFGSVQIESIETSDLLDLGEPVRVTVTFRVAELATRQGDALVLEPGFGDWSMQHLASKTEREFALLLGTPSSDEQRVVYRLPEGFEPASLPEAADVGARFGRFEVEWRDATGGGIEAVRRRAFDANRIEPEEYPMFREFSTEFDAAMRRVVLARRKS